MFARVYCLESTQDFAVSREVCWEFFSNPLNLPKITPPWLRFDASGTKFQKAYPGLILQYRVAPVLRIPMRWVTEITHVDPSVRFVDEQRFGPYTFWHHQHLFEDIPGGARMHDIVHYALPLGPIGWVMNSLFVHRQLKQIFEYRSQVLKDFVGTLKG